ncbi:MAG: hypothetical protein HKO63_06665 [Acidimicrobiia bacterium]|nr:hypothetical protein [Acidimicrobiia bacterium]MBT8192900.1 hypothetical protein [Acidimicrobiia bacterium]NNF89683.1 hypothetical protein [Acidimicrobiia bacterium]NNJ47916.1 hypothetical protein [Acidimicrobiia bacterium]NNL14178.1 hypothetical protein [Acidimicrobiia bacterium]
MRKMVVVLSVLALVLAGCTSGGGADCSAIVDDGMVFFQDVIDDLDGKSLADLESNPLTASDYATRARELERRTANSDCSDAEIADLLGARIDELEAGPTNPAGQAFISALISGIERGGFSFGS